jgi:hypothetical protein
MSAAAMTTAVFTATVSAAAMPTAVFTATVSAATMPAATMPAATMSAATPAGVCFECEKRHYEEQRSGHASASRQHRPHCVAGLSAPYRGGRLSLGIPPRTKNF